MITGTTIDLGCEYNKYCIDCYFKEDKSCNGEEARQDFRCLRYKTAKYCQIIDENFKGSNPEDYTVTTSVDYIPEKIKLDDFHYHEMMDRIHVINCTINDHLLEHPVAFKHKRLFNKIEKALDLLGDAYQMTGNLNVNSDKPIYTQKQMDAQLSKAGVLTGKDANIFLENIKNPKPLSPEVKERMLQNFNAIQEKSNIR